VADFTGSWDITIDTPVGRITPVFVISDDHGSLRGVAHSEEGAIDFYDVVAEGNRLTWKQDVTTPMKLSLTFDVVVDGDTMVGTSKAGIFPASTVNGIRTPST
jgi:hypothetical protein